MQTYTEYKPIDLKGLVEFQVWKEQKEKLKALSFDPLGDGISRIQYIDHMGDDFGVVESARASRTHPEDIEWRGDADVKLINHMMTERHTVPFEHNAVKLFVVAPLSIAVQWLRHRIASYSMLSRRYTSKDVEFYIPEVWRMQSKKNKQGSEGSVEADEWVKMYDSSLLNADYAFSYATEDLGIANEQARFILPQGVYTRFYVTTNLHSWMNFYDLREDHHAQEEIRLYTDGLDAILSSIFPISWKLYKKQRKERKFLEAMFSVEYDEKEELYFVKNNYFPGQAFTLNEKTYQEFIGGK
jgi:thymidylate synthase, flavin-dependent